MIRRYFFVFIILLGLISLASAQEHPKLFFTAEDLAQIKNLLSDPAVDANGVSFKAMGDNIKARADSWLNQVISTSPAKPDDYKKAFPVLNYLSFAYLITGDSRYADKAKDTLLKVCNWPEWGKSISFFYISEVTMAVAIGYDLLYDQLTETEREKVRKSLLNLGITPLKTIVGQSIGNDNLVPGSALGCASLVLQGEEPTADALIADAKGRMKGILDSGYSMSRDGGYPEGLGYGTVGFDGDGTNGAILFIDALKRVTGDASLLNHPYMSGLLEFALYTMSPNGRWGTGISDTWGYPGFQLTVLRMSSELNNGYEKYAKWFLKKCGYLKSSGGAGDFSGVNTVIALFYYYYAKDVLAESPQNKLPTSKRFRGMDWITLRNTWDDPDGILLSLKCGPGYYHENNDENAFQIFGYGSEVAADQGYKHTWFASGTYGHNSILVDDEGQVVGWVDGRYGKISKFITSEEFDYSLGEASLAYGESSPYLTKWYRHLIFAKPNYFIVYDDLVSKDNIARKFSFLLQIAHIHSIAQKGEFVISGDTVISRPTNNSTTGQLYSKIILPESDFNVESKMYTQHGENYGPTCHIYPSSNLPETKFLVVLYPQQNNASAADIAGFTLASGTGKGIEINEAGVKNLHLINFASGIISGKNMETDGFTAQVSLGVDLRPITYVLVDGTTLKYQERTLVSSDKPGKFVFSRWSEYNRTGGVPQRIISPYNLVGKVQGEASKISFFSNLKIKTIYVDKLMANYEYNQATQMVSLSLSAGEHDILVIGDYPTDQTVIPKDDTKKDNVYPNPYIKGKSPGGKINFSNLGKEAIIRIYASDGELIREINSNSDGQAEWDVSEVSGGVYLYVATSAEGVKRGKVSIIK